MPEETPHVRDELFHSIRALTRWTIVLFLSVVIVSGLGFYDSVQQSREIHQVSYNNRNALCNFRFDLQRRYDAGVQFLKENPDGIPGITAETLQRSIDSQKATLDALRILDCSDIPNRLKE